MGGDIIEFIDSNEHNVFNNIFYEYRGVLLRTARQILKDEYYAEEAVQKTFIKLSYVKIYDRIKRLDSLKRKYYLIRMVKNISIDILRTNFCPDQVYYSNDNNLIKYSVDTIEEYHQKINNLELIKMINNLPYTYKSVIIERIIYEKDIGEIAAQNGINEALVRKRLSRARKKLKIYCEEIIKAS